MPASETFDAFYARTVWSVTNQMHELAADDPNADHAIREAYAKAYQQWYQVSGYPDPQAWVLTTARAAYERRRAAAGLNRRPSAQSSESRTGRERYLPPAQPGGGQGQPLAGPDGTIAGPWRNGAGAGRIDGTGASTPGTVPAPPNYPAPGAMSGGSGSPAGGKPTAVIAAGAAATADQANHRAGWLGVASEPGRAGGQTSADGLGPDEPGRGGLGSGAPGRNGLGDGTLQQPPGGWVDRLGSRRNMMVAGVVAVAALAIAVVAYSAGGGNKAPAPAASQHASSKPGGRPKPHMLAAGRTGRRSAIPWSLVGPGWALAELSTAAPNSAGQASGGGSYITYLVDPKGGKYEITASSGGTAPGLMAWSGDAQRALVYTGSGAAGGTGSYALLNVRTGHFAPLPLPDGVVPVGFARPLGLAILAVHQGPAQFHLQRYTLTGQLQQTLAALPRKLGETLAWNTCDIGAACALSSPDGLTDVWGVAGDAMQVVSNAGGKATRLHVKDSGHPSACMPLSWWNDTTVLADCAATGAPDGARLWLVPDDRSAPTPLTPVVSAAQGGIRDAWLAGQTTYVSSVTSRQCPSAPGGPGGMAILRLGAGGPVTIPGSTNNYSTVVVAYRQRLLVLTQTSCPGTSSLLWFNPAAGRAQTALTAPAAEVGVIGAVPFGNGPTVITNGY